ncbi:hypothetical protein LJR289_004720 [Pseudoduganella sp. LjRoot289]|uniref:hypothetical protein n=1 Tax=Pseudoduganella sp. LjRoot289 TaxID=3342314 RepID=UPI003ECE405F
MLQQRAGGLTACKKVLDFGEIPGLKYFTYAQRDEKWYGFAALWGGLCKWLIIKRKKSAFWLNPGRLPVTVNGFLKLSTRCSQSYPQTGGYIFALKTAALSTLF